MLFIAWVAYNGIDQIKWVQNIGSPILIVVMIGLLAWAYSITPDGTGFFEVMAQPSDDALIEASGGFAFVYLTGLMKMNINAFGPEMPLDETIAWSVDLLRRYTAATDVETAIVEP